MEGKYNFIITGRGTVDVYVMHELITIDGFMINEIDTFRIFPAWGKSQTSLTVTNNDKIETIHLDSSCKVEKLVISNCPNLKKIKYENSKTLKVVKIDDVSCKKVEMIDFNFCRELEKFDISNRFPNLIDCMLQGVNLKSIDIRSSTKIEFGMFGRNSNLTELNLPDTASNLMSITISDTPNLEKIILPKVSARGAWIEQ